MKTQEKALGEPYGNSAKSPSRSRVRPLVIFFAVVALFVLAAVVVGLLPRLRREQTLQASVEAVREQLPVVNVTAVRLSPANAPLELPGDLQALVEAPIFARADGYIIKRYLDLGDTVKTGQALADIETPELDQQIMQARAMLSNSKSTLVELQAALTLATANLKLAERTAERWAQLEKQGVISHQDADEKNSNLDVRRAEVEAARSKIASARDLEAASDANLRRLQQLKGFAHVTSPISGIITSRLVDVGTLITSGNGGPARELFRVADTTTMRIFVNVPQAYAGSIHKGEKAEVRIQEFPGQVFPAEVARFAHEVDAASRSMLAVLLVPNPRGILYPGTYAQVRFATAQPRGAMLIPGDAMILGSNGTRVASVDSADRIHLRNIQVGTDFGGEVEVLSGLVPGELVVRNPTDVVRDGVQVEVRKLADSQQK